MTDSSPNGLVRSRRRDTERRIQRVADELEKMKADGSEISVSAVAKRAGVHRSFIHRHSDLHAAVLAAAAEVVTQTPAASTVMSHRSLQAENANLRGQARRYAQRIKELEDRLSEHLGGLAFERSGLGAPSGLEELRVELNVREQENLELRHQAEERAEELAGARETIRQLMNELNRA